MWHLSFAQSPDLLWANTTSNSDWIRMMDMTIDNTSNSYCVGDYKGTADFDPGASTLNLTSNGLDDMSLQKFNGSGMLTMTISIGGIGNDRINAVHVDDDGSIYLTGIFSDTVDFDPGVGVENRVSQASTGNFFLLKPTAQGQFQWVKTLVSTSAAIGGTNLKTDPQGNIIVSGYFAGTVDFDPNATTYELTSQSGSGSDLFFLKLDQSGSFVWAKLISGSSGETCNAIDVDVFGNLYAVGKFSDDIDLDPGPLTHEYWSHGLDDLFIFSLNADGEYRWSYAAGGNQQDYLYDVSVSGNGTCFAIGEFTNQLTLKWLATHLVSRF